MSQTANNLAAYCWSIADLLRGDFKQSQYGRIILPFTLLRRMECVLADSKDKVLAEHERVKALKLPEEAQEKLLLRASGLAFFNTSKMDLSKLGEAGIKANLESYLQGFSRDAREIFEYFNFAEFVGQLNDANLLYKVVQKVRATDLSPMAVSNHDMGLVFEELIRRFAESSNETAGEHFTPRDIVRLTTALVFMEDDDALSGDAVIRTIYDPTAGTGGFLSSGMEYLYELNPSARLVPYGQELNPESYAICKADMLIKGQAVGNIKLGNTLSNDQLFADRFDYMLSNPPFGVDWKKIEGDIRKEAARGYAGRFGAGLPRVSDGSLLFLLHLISKLRDAKSGGGRIGIILNGSPLFTGGAGSGESEIRRYILEADLLEAIVALPTDMFYNTGIATYVWVLSNKKAAARKGKVQLINGVNLYGKMRKSLGSKRNEMSEDDIRIITRCFGAFETVDRSKIFPTHAFGYRRITVERPLRESFQFSDERLATLSVASTLLKARQLQALIGTAQCDDMNTYEAVLTRAYLDLNIRLDAAEKKQIRAAVSWKNPAAAKVIKRRHKNTEPNPLYGLFAVDDRAVEYEADSDLRDYENVALDPSQPVDALVDAYFRREVLPHVADAWIDSSKRDPKDNEVGLVGYEIPFNRHFYVYQPPRDLTEIDADLDAVSAEIMQLLREVHS